jgi:hypothetical protein
MCSSDSMRGQAETLGGKLGEAGFELRLWDNGSADREG